MSWIDNLFTRPQPVIQPSQPAGEQTFTDRAIASLDGLASASRAASPKLSPAAYSALRTIDDNLRPVIERTATHPVLIEREIEILSVITDYVPTSLELFLRLPDADRADGGRGDRMLIEQLDRIERTTRAMAAHVADDAMTAMEAQAIFLQNKYDHSGTKS
ncbi:hypothetical protein [Agromyces humi]|uniref:hypothetical protein n=1 Tax=Agromyces humi TaxID=1766800 RepID=UPI00135A4CCC|nr:hypothetical protein [Agromyces humi]